MPATRTLRRPADHRPATRGRPEHSHERGTRVLRDGTVVRPRPAPPRKKAGPRPVAKKTTRARRRRPQLRIPLAAPGRRLHLLLIVIGMALSLCAGRLVQLQGFDSSSYSVDALTRTLPLLPARGEITDRNGLVLAATQPAVAVTADPSLTAPRAMEIAGVLSTHLGMTTTELLPLLTKPNTRFVYLKKKVPALTYTALATDLAKRKVYGVFRENDPIRTYPNSSVGSSVVGFVGADGKGLAGLELKMDASLAGVEGKQTYQSAPNGSKIPLGESSVTPAKNGIRLSAHAGLRDRVGRAAQGRGHGAFDEGRLRVRHRDGHQDRPGSGPGPRTELRLRQSAGGEAGGSRQPGDLGPLRTGQRAEGPHRGCAVRLRHRHPEHQGRGAQPNRFGGSLHQGPLLPREASLQPCAGSSPTPPTSARRC